MAGLRKTGELVRRASPQTLIQGGGSELEDLTLLCGRHHRLVHEGGWQLVKTTDGRMLPIAPTVTFGSARGPD